MQIKKQGSCFIIKTQYSDGSYEKSEKYYFNSLEAVKKFVNRIRVEDVYGNKRSMSYYEMVVDIYERIDYSVEYD